MTVDFTIKPVVRQEEVCAAALIVGQQVSQKTIDENERPTLGTASRFQAEQAMCNPRFSFFAAYRLDGAAIGYISGEVRPSIYVEGQINGYELFWAVIDKYRRSGVGIALLNVWEDYCKSQGCKHVYMGLTSRVEPEILRHIYAKRGYTLHSESYSKTF